MRLSFVQYTDASPHLLLARLAKTLEEQAAKKGDVIQQVCHPALEVLFRLPSNTKTHIAGSFVIGNITTTQHICGVLLTQHASDDSHPGIARSRHAPASTERLQPFLCRQTRARPMLPGPFDYYLASPGTSSCGRRGSSGAPACMRQTKGAKMCTCLRGASLRCVIYGPAIALIETTLPVLCSST